MAKNLDFANFTLPEVKLPEVKLPEQAAAAAGPATLGHGHGHGDDDWEDAIIELLESIAALEGKFDYLLLQMIVKLWYVGEIGEEITNSDIDKIRHITESYSTVIRAFTQYQESIAKILFAAGHED